MAQLEDSCAPQLIEPFYVSLVCTADGASARDVYGSGRGPPSQMAACPIADTDRESGALLRAAQRRSKLPYR